METQGKLHKKFEAQQVTERFRKREFVLEMIDNPKYPQHVLFQLTGDRCDLLDEYKEGQEVQVEFNLRGREWTSPKGDVKYFNSLEVWKMNAMRAAAAGSSSRGDDEPPPYGDDDVPF